MTIWWLLREHQLYPYHLQHLKALSPEDYSSKLTFCRWFLQQCGTNPNFAAVVFFTNEATLTRDGIKNLHNQHVWADINFHATIQSSHQERYSINIRAGIVVDCLLGPYVFPTGLLEDMPLASRRLLRFMHDCAPAHFSLSARTLSWALNR
jgi:hypothetical protein